MRSLTGRQGPCESLRGGLLQGGTHGPIHHHCNIGGRVAYFYRVVLLALFCVAPAFALVPVQTTTSWSFGSHSGSAESAVAACAAGVAHVKSLQPSCTYYGSPCTFEMSFEGGVCNAIRNSNTAYLISLSTGAASCPPNSTPSGSECKCASGFIEKDGLCAPSKSPKCGELEGKGLGISEMMINVGTQSVAWMRNAVGRTMTSCFPGGCQVSGTSGSCMGGGSGSTLCLIGSPSFTGLECDDQAPPGQCPPGTTASAYVPGVCIPDANDCPTGYVKSKYADVCIPADNPDDPNKPPDGNDGKPSSCPTGRCPSKYVKDLCIPCESSTGKDGSTTTCVGNICTTTSPAGQQTEKDKSTFCSENPDSPLCVKGEFGGTCRSGFSCKGDAIQCAIAQEQHRRSCKLLDDQSAESNLYELHKGKSGNQTGDLPGNETINMAGRIDTSDALGAGSAGVSDLSVTVWGRSLTLPFSMLNPYLDALGKILLAVSFLIALRIVARG